jgi:hypothetical protein
VAAFAPGIARALVRVFAGLGIAAGALLFVLKAPGPFTLSTHLFALWLVLPWLLALALTLRGYVRGSLSAALLMAAFELVAFYVTFVAPRGSTSALIYAVKPVWQIGLMAVAMVVARLVEAPVGRGRTSDPTER